MGTWGEGEEREGVTQGGFRGKDFYHRQGGREDGIPQAGCHVASVAEVLVWGGGKGRGIGEGLGEEDIGGYIRPSHTITWPVITQIVNDINLRLGTLCLSH